MRSSTIPPSARRPRGRRRSRCSASRGIASTPSRSPAASSGDPTRAGRAGRPARCPEPDTPSLSFTMASVSVGLRVRISCTAATMSSTVWRSSAPTGQRTPSSSNDAATSGLAAEVGQSWVGAVHRGCRDRGRRRARGSRVVGDQVATCGVGDHLPDLPQQPRPGQQLRAQRPGTRHRPGPGSGGRGRGWG